VTRRLAEPSPKSSDRSQLTEKPNLADRHGLPTDRSITLRRRECERERQVECRFVKNDAAHEIRIDVAVANGYPRSSAEDGGEQRKTRRIKATPRASWCAKCGARNECLHLNQHWPTPLKERGDHRTRCTRLSIINEGAAWIVNSAEPSLPHLQQSEFIC
jgi:hypothetical protein